MFRERLRAIASRRHTTTLLVAAMLAPMTAPWFGLPTFTPLAVSLGAHTLTVGAVLLAGAAGMWLGDTAPSRRNVIEWMCALLLAIAAAFVLASRSNSFYTATALMEGMTFLLGVHLATRVLRHGALLPGDGGLTRAFLPRWINVIPRRRGMHVVRHLPVLPAVTLADALTVAIGWLVLLAWILIALGHRNVAIPPLLLSGALQAIALIVLVPEALAGFGWLSRERTTPADAPVPHDLESRVAIARDAHAHSNVRPG